MNREADDRLQRVVVAPPRAPQLRIRIFPAMLLVVAAIVWIVAALALATIIIANHVAGWMHAGTPGWEVVLELALCLTLLVGGCCLLFSGIACWRAKWPRMLLMGVLATASLGTIYFVQQLFGVAAF